MERERSFHWAWIILATGFVNLFINYSVRLGYGVMLPEMIRDLSLSRTAAGSIYNAYLFAYVSLTPLTGILTDRLGARRVIACCAFILAAGVTLMGTVESLWLACLAFGIAGLGATGMWTPVITVVQRWFAPHRRGLALGILSAGYGLGFATMGVAFPWIVRNFTWRYAWYILGAAALVMVVVNGSLLRSDPESSGWKPWGQRKTNEVPKIQSGQPQDRSLSMIFRTPVFWLIGFSYFAVTYSFYGITTFMVDYARDQLGLPIAQASFLATIHGLGQIAGVLTILPLSDYWGRKKTIMISNAFITVCLIGVLWGGNSWIILYAVVGVLAFFSGAIFPIYGACAGDYFPKKVMGTIIGVWTVFYGVGAISVHWVSGLIRDTTGSYHNAFVITVITAAVSIVFMYFVEKSSKQ